MMFVESRRPEKQDPEHKARNPSSVPFWPLHAASLSTPILLVIPGSDGQGLFQADARDRFTLCHASPRAIFLSFPAKVRHFVGARYDLRNGIWIAIAEFGIQTQRVLRRRQAFPGFPEYPLDVVLKR
jgi:hypothetical protein